MSEQNGLTELGGGPIKYLVWKVLRIWLVFVLVFFSCKVIVYRLSIFKTSCYLFLGQLLYIWSF